MIPQFSKCDKVRPGQGEKRLSECTRLGFKARDLPKRQVLHENHGLEILPVNTIDDLQAFRSGPT